MRSFAKVREEKAGKVGMHSFVATDELVRKGETRHETTFLEPEDGGEATREENTLNGRKGNQPLGEGGSLIRNPSQCPVGLLFNAGDGLDGIEKEFALGRILDVGVNEQGVCLGVDVFPEVG
jgi:hypothetical protein